MIGAIIIGRNEGERLRRCIESVISQVKHVIYVDSGSTDKSLSIAGKFGVEVVELDMTRPFTAARARNTGFQRLNELVPDLKYVHFIDGDCELFPGWVDKATSFLEENPKFAVICGRRRERYPEHSIFNSLCDIEWDTPVGEAKACGGDAIFRIDAFESVGGFRIDLIAGEEPELCVRLRQNGWRVWRLDAEMTLHDADMTRFSQWWKRAVRSGYAFAEGVYLHGREPERYRIRESQRIWFWSTVLPAMIVLLAQLTPWLSLVFLIYPLQIMRLVLKGHRATRENWLHAIFLVLAKFPEVVGQMKFIFNRTTGKQGTLIEYK